MAALAAALAASDDARRGAPVLRTVPSGWRIAAGAAAAADVPTATPPWLGGRFGPKPQLVVVAAADGRQFEPGCLVYPSSDTAGPLAAIGAVVGPQGGEKPGARVLAARAAITAGATLFVRDSSGPVPVSLVEKVKPAAAAAPVGAAEA